VSRRTLLFEQLDFTDAHADNPHLGGGCAILCTHALKLPRAFGADYFETVGQSGEDDQDKFKLPTASGFAEDFLEGGACRFVIDVEFRGSGSQCFSCDEMKC